MRQGKAVDGELYQQLHFATLCSIAIKGGGMETAGFVRAAFEQAVGKVRFAFSEQPQGLPDHIGMRNNDALGLQQGCQYLAAR